MLAIIVGLGYVYFVNGLFLVNAAKQSTDLIFNYPFSWVVLLLIVVVLVNCLLSVLAVMFGISPTYVRHLTIDGEGGRIAVALDAVEEYLQRKASMVSGVKDLQIHAEVSAGSLVVHSRLTLILERDIPTFSREFQGLLSREISSTLGFQNIQEIRVIINKMVSGEGAIPAKEPTEPAETEVEEVPIEPVPEEPESVAEEEPVAPREEEPEGPPEEEPDRFSVGEPERFPEEEPERFPEEELERFPEEERESFTAEKEEPETRTDEEPEKERASDEGFPFSRENDEETERER